MLNHSNHLITISLYRDSTIALAHRDGKYCAIPARHRDSFLAHNRDNGPDGFAGNANSLNCRAVSGYSKFLYPLTHHDFDFFAF